MRVLIIEDDRPLAEILSYNLKQAGYDVLKDIEFPWPVAQVALQHHERINGSGAG